MDCCWRRFVAGYWAVLHRVGTVMSMILLTVLYFTVLALTAIVARLFGADLLHLRRRASYWRKRDKPTPTDPSRYTHPY